ncbi:hypothetical protein BpHYR1_034929 [Brachionus plicatilis]|uniref:Uncharacterized protein n=1 Tax=Brachionus plicatilis TaxID=10195 RepID=A0A3M7S3X8_BRAPC|nr:hypothetical protein BpHYR1_034929 [Brachionus plicatilis]
MVMILCQFVKSDSMKNFSKNCDKIFIEKIKIYATESLLDDEIFNFDFLVPKPNSWTLSTTLKNKYLRLQNLFKIKPVTLKKSFFKDSVSRII